jgi:SAM-dependent methyltransferase
LQDLVFRVTPSLDRNVGRAAEQLAELLGLGSRQAPILALNIGGKHASACARLLLGDERVDCVELDVAPSPATDIVADPLRLPFPPGAFHLVVADAILEHLPDPDAAVREMHRVLARGGLVLSDTPFLLPVHGGAFDFGRFGQLAHRRLFRDFDELAAGVSAGPACALAHSIEQFLLSFVVSRAPRYAVKLLCRLSFFWLRYFDSYLADKPGAMDGALGFYFIGRKSDTSLSDRELLRAYRGATPDLYRR